MDSIRLASRCGTSRSESIAGVTVPYCERDGVMATRMTAARGNLEVALKDVSLLIVQHDVVRREQAGHDRRLEVFKRSAVILTVTAWESYIEDTLASQFSQRLGDARSPADMRPVFNYIARRWMGQRANKPPDLIDCTGENWKSVMRSYFQKDLGDLHTPSSRYIEGLSQRYLGMNLVERWKWRGTSSQQASQRLYELIELRGRLVHRSQKVFDQRHGAKKADAVKGRDLILRLAQCTDEALGVAPSKSKPLRA